MRASGAWCLAVAVAALALLLAGCGVPGEPLPPLLEIPAPVPDLTAEQVGSRIVLRFSKPQLTTEGTLVRYLDRIEIHGAFLPSGASPELFWERGTVLATLSTAQLADGAEQLNYELPVDGSQRGTKAVLGIKAINHRNQDAGFSNIVSIEIVDLPEPPADLRATLTEHSIELRWTPAPRSVFGGPAPAADGYEVFRAEAGSALPNAPTPTTVQTATDSYYEDRSFRFGARYVYSVRAYVQRGESKAVTPHSETTLVDPVDRFPPAAPENLRAVAVPGAVELAWSPNQEPDLAGYNVYRSDSGEFTRINAELLALPLFRDGAARAGVEYRYEVKAVDRNRNEGPPSQPATAPAE